MNENVACVNRYACFASCNIARSRSHVLLVGVVKSIGFYRYAVRLYNDYTPTVKYRLSLHFDSRTGTGTDSGTTTGTEEVLRKVRAY